MLFSNCQTTVGGLYALYARVINPIFNNLV